MDRFLKNPVSGVDVEVLTTTGESGGKLFKIKSTMRANQMNKAPFHYHNNFSEHFTVEEGQLNMMVGNNRKNIVLKAGEDYLVKEMCPHTFWNQSDERVTYTVEIAPARGFEKALRLNHALAATGMASKKGTPANIFHIAILARLGNTWFFGIPRWFQVFVFSVLSGMAFILGIKKKLYRLV